MVDNIKLDKNKMYTCGSCQYILYCPKCATGEVRCEAVKLRKEKKRYKPKPKEEHKPKGRPTGSKNKKTVDSEQKKHQRQLNYLKKKITTLNLTEQERDEIIKTAKISKDDF